MFSTLALIPDAWNRAAETQPPARVVYAPECEDGVVGCADQARLDRLNSAAKCIMTPWPLFHEVNMVRRFFIKLSWRGSVSHKGEWGHE